MRAFIEHDRAGSLPLRQVWVSKPTPNFSSQKIQKSSKSVLTLEAAPDYIRLTNEGGAPLATKKFASKIAPELSEIKRAA
jgi:hypothetical protein